ncbi:MAG: tetratricopeptide repeat protein [Candidatus Caldatribacteriaceae bacterium]
MKRTLFFLLGLFVALGLYGCFRIGGRGNVTGEVWNNVGPIEGVLVEGGGKSTLTDADGRFLLEDVSTGNCYIFFSHPSYTGAVLEVEVADGETRSINAEGRVVLQERSDENLKEYLFTLYELSFYGRVLEGARDFLSAYPMSPFAASVTFLEGASLFYLGRYQEAIEPLGVVVGRFPGDPFADDAQYLLAKCFGEGLRGYSRAIVEYRKLIEKYPDSGLVGSAWYEMGDCLYILGSFPDAFFAYENAISFGGEVAPKALYSAAHCLYRMEFYNRAAEKFLEYVALYPATDLSDDAQYFAGASLYKAGRFAEALQAFDDCMRLYPQGTWYNGIIIAPAALFHKGLCLEKLGRYLEAYNLYLKIIRKYPGAKWADGSSLVRNVQFRIEWLKKYVL